MRTPVHLIFTKEEAEALRGKKVLLRSGETVDVHPESPCEEASNCFRMEDEEGYRIYADHLFTDNLFSTPWDIVEVLE